MTRKYLSGQGAADYLGMKRGSFVSLTNLPKPDAMIGNVRGWTPRTLDAWNATRPGRGNWGKKTPDKRK